MFPTESFLTCTYVSFISLIVYKYNLHNSNESTSCFLIVINYVEQTDKNKEIQASGQTLELTRFPENETCFLSSTTSRSSSAIFGLQARNMDATWGI
jgi:hypothetical protein